MYYSDELYHHGIKGQRWGRRNGPPYPLSPQTHASVVRSTSTGSKSSKKGGKIGKLPEHLSGYRKVTRKDFEDEGFLKKFKGATQNEKESASYNRVRRQRDIAGAKSLIGLQAATVGAGMTAAGIGSKSAGLTAAGLATGLGGVGSMISGRLQRKKATAELDKTTNDMFKRNRLKDLQAYKGKIYVKDNKSGIKGLNDNSGDYIDRNGRYHRHLEDGIYMRYKKGKKPTDYDTSTTPRIKGLDDRNMSSEDKAARRRRIAKGAAIGVGVGALALGGAVAAKKLGAKYASMSQKAMTRANTRADFVNKYDALRAKPFGNTNVLIRKNQAMDLGSKKGLAIRSMKLNQGKRYANLAYNAARKSARLNNLRRLGLATAAVAPVASTAIAARRKKKRSSRR